MLLLILADVQHVILRLNLLCGLEIHEEIPL